MTEAKVSSELRIESKEHRRIARRIFGEVEARSNLEFVNRDALLDSIVEVLEEEYQPEEPEVIGKCELWEIEKLEEVKEEDYTNG